MLESGPCVGRNLILLLCSSCPITVAQTSPSKVAGFAAGLFWCHFLTVGESGEALYILIYFIVTKVALL